MGLAGGVFYGYRELERGLDLPHKLPPPFALDSPPQTTPMEIERLETPTYRYEVYSGQVGDAYPGTMTEIPFTTRMLIISIEGQLIMQYSFDGANLQPEQELRGDFRVIQAIRAFRVRNAVIGWPAWYQLVAML